MIIWIFNERTVMRWMEGILLVLVCFSFVVSAQEDRIQELQEKILKQQQLLQELEQKVAEKEKRSENYVQSLVDEYMAQPVAQDDGEGITAGYDKGFFIQAADGDVQLKINGYLRYHFFLSEANTVQNNNFRASESRIDFHIYLMKDWHIRIRPEFSANGALREAYIEYLGMDCAKFRIGTFIIPFSLEYETAPQDLLAISYSPYIINGIMPQRDNGIMIFGNGVPFVNSTYLADHLSYAIGLYNGQGLNVGDADDDKMFAAQLKFFPMGNKEQGVFGQASVFVNNHDLRAGAGRVLLGALQNYQVFDRPGDTLDNTSGRAIGVASGFKYWKGNLRIESEYVWMRANRDNEGIAESATPLEIWGASFGLSYFIAVGDPKQNMGLEPLFKVSYTDVDDKGGDGTAANVTNPLGTVTDVRGQEIWELVFGAKFHFNKHVRADFNWVMYDLRETRGITNNERGEGGGLLHAFVFQIMTKW